MRGEGSALLSPCPHIGIIGRSWNKRPQGRDENRGVVTGPEYYPGQKRTICKLIYVNTSILLKGLGR